MELVTIIQQSLVIPIILTIPRVSDHTENIIYLVFYGVNILLTVGVDGL